VHAFHFLGMSGIDGQHGAESRGCEVALDNLLEMWQAKPVTIPGGSNVTGKAIHAKDQRSITFEMVKRFVEPCHRAQLPDLPQYGLEITKTHRGCGVNMAIA
jgi:hypothetical protein